MCNLFSNLTAREAMQRIFAVLPANDHLGADWSAAAEIWPKRQAAVLHLDTDNDRHLSEMQWGFLLPQTSRRTGKPILPKAVTNARDDRIGTSGFWAGSLANRRCLVPATAYCEFSRRSSTGRHWYAVAPGETFAFAGIWTRFEGVIGGERQSLRTFAIATTRPNALAMQIHNRMPVILDPGNYDQWLTGNVDDAASLLQPAPDDLLTELP